MSFGSSVSNRFWPDPWSRISTWSAAGHDASITPFAWFEWSCPPRAPRPPRVCVCVWLRGPPIHPAVLCGDMRGRRVPWVRPAGLRTVVPRSDVVMVPDKPSVPAPRRQRQGSLVVKQPVINVFAPDYDPEATAGAREYERMRQHQRTLDRITRRLRPSWPREGVHRILGRLRFEDPMPGKRRWQVENSVVNGAPLGLARDVRAR